MVELLAAQCFNGAKKFAFDVFLFLVYFVLLQVMTKGVWWVSFWNGVQFQLLNENSSWALWIMFCKEIGKMISGKRGDEVMRSMFDAGWECEGMFFGDEEKLSC